MTCVSYLEDLRDFVKLQGPYVFPQASLPNYRLVRIPIPVIPMLSGKHAIVLTQYRACIHCHHDSAQYKNRPVIPSQLRARHDHQTGVNPRRNKQQNDISHARDNDAWSRHISHRHSAFGIRDVKRGYTRQHD